MKKISSFLFSMLFTGILVIVFAMAIAYATFIENDYGTATARILVYNSKWFEVLLVIICINLTGSLFVNNLFTRKKWPGFLLHIAFIFIIIGAGITRYFGFEGTMHIRESESSDFIISEETFIKISANDRNSKTEKEFEVKFSPYTANRFSKKIHVNNKTIHVKNLQYVPSASEAVVPDPDGEPVISLLAAGKEMQRTDFNLKNGGHKTIYGKTFGFNIPDADLCFESENENLYLISADTVFMAGMNGEQAGSIMPGIKYLLKTQTVYTAGEVHFAIKQFLKSGTVRPVYSPEQGGTGKDALITEIKSGDETSRLFVYGNRGDIAGPYTTTIDGTEVSVSFGSKKIELPFSIYLEKFELERYPGSNSPSSYASEVILKDNGIEKPFRIFMNNILRYKGYRFFQSSYDTDEKGTILSVNSDEWGTSVTYSGYFILAVGFILTLFNKNSRFMKLIKASSRLREERKKLFIALALLILLPALNPLQAQPAVTGSKKHISEFEELLLQSSKGRTEPAITLASEILRKVSQKNKWQGMGPAEVFLSMQANPEHWKNIPLIKINDPQLRKLLNIKGNYTSFNNIALPNESGGYRLSKAVSDAFSKKVSERTKFDKEVINADERVNILFNVFNGSFLTIFPVPGHENYKWVNVKDSKILGAEGEAFSRESVQNYLAAVASGNWEAAADILNRLKEYQHKEGLQIIPSKTKIRFEILYHKWDIFGKLSKLLLSMGLLLLMMQLYTIFNPEVKPVILYNAILIAIILLFAVHTAGLAIRWYISGHAPWSNGYESMIFVSWATMLAGLLFVKRSEITLSLTTMFAGITLLVAGFSWMSPEITNLVPVLKSYWLIIHVAIIMASYGFLGIGAMLGMLNLLLMIFRNRSNKSRINHTIKELVVIIHISLILGLLLLTAGSFIGGIWANESWGRYWGWDPKETWAMVTILVYTFIVHMHKIPGFRGSYAVSAASFAGFGSVLMTYFGVNYYLSGLHSYAQGEPVPVPAGVYIAAALVVILLVTAFYSDRKENVKEIAFD